MDNRSPAKASAKNVVPSEVPNRLAGLMTGAATAAARKRVVCPPVHTDMKPAYD
jgi:hypothetical protein